MDNLALETNLFLRYLEGVASDADFDALNLLLAENAAARRRFVDISSREWQLIEMLPGETRQAEPAQVAEAPIPIYLPGCEPKPSRFRPHHYAIAIAAALLVAGIAVAIVSVVAEQNRQREIEQQKAELAERIAKRPVATLIEFSEGSNLTTPGGFISEGRDYPRGEYALSSGTAEFMLTNAVNVKLRGETRLYMRNDMNVTLTRGSAEFVCPEGTKGFTVHLLDRSKIVDLGTAFRVDVDPDGQTRLQVIDGVVDWSAASPDTVPIRITAGQHARMIDGRPVVEVDVLRIDLELANSPPGQQTQTAWEPRQIATSENAPAQRLVDPSADFGVTPTLETSGSGWGARGGLEQARAQVTGTSFNDVVEDFWITRAGRATLTLTGLIPGTRYTLEAWHNDTYQHAPGNAGFAKDGGLVTPSISGGNAHLVEPGAITHRLGAQSDRALGRTRIEFDAVETTAVITLISDNPNGFLPINGLRLRAASGTPIDTGRTNSPLTHPQQGAGDESSTSESPSLSPLPLKETTDVKK